MTLTSTSRPVVLHDAKNLTADPSRGLATLVVAPLDNLKHHGSYRNDTTESSWELGVYSQVTSLPAGFTHRTLMVAGAGVTATMERYGALVQRLAKTNKSEAMSKDRVVNKLGYVRIQMPVYLSVRLPVRLSAHLSICPSTSLPRFLLVSLMLNRVSSHVHTSGRTPAPTITQTSRSSTT